MSNLQAVRSSMPARRELALGAAVLCVLVLAVSLLAVAGAPAHARSDRAARLTTTYSCSNPQFGGGSSAVTIGTTLPSSVRTGARLPARTVRATITVPDRMVRLMRQYGVRSVTGKASGATYRVGAKKVAISDMRIPRTNVPASGAMRITGTGRAGAVTLTRAGRYVVRIPASFQARVTATFSGGQTIAISMNCSVASGAPTRLGTIRVT
ncbi:DUF6801 domain-containing protein [Nocardioides sp. R-C-SC26]|uniref:DUF6801 domain-containing protein n=1 Tax=Nocardioides sp. R-C-SC26 TaxID=2870414 RepID=UPI001E4B744E|nr:DUF6801 domain-containing protein [Nocardioides sp. R-C-SC26]